MTRDSSPRTIFSLALTGMACLLWATVLSARAQDPEQPGDTPAATPAVQHEVTIQYLRFAPDPVEIVVGETVTWVNRDALPHTVTAVQGDTPHSPDLGLGDRYQQTFTTPGTFQYICLYHKQMHGTIVVRTE